jgi:hypothetical protein
MKKQLMIIPLVILLCFLVGLCALPTFAQGEEQKAQSYMVIEFVIKPGKLADFEAAWKEGIEECKKQNYYLPIYGYSMDFLHFYAFYPVPLYSGIEDFFKAYGDYVKKMGMEKLQKMHEREYASIEYYKMFFIRYREDLSFQPEVPKYNFDQERFCHWGLCFVKPGKEKKFEQIFQAIKNFYKKKGLKDIEYGADMYVGDIGIEMPFYFFWENGEGQAHFWNQAEKRHDAVGQELFNLFWELMETCRKFEMQWGWFRPDLSYLPKEK